MFLDPVFWAVQGALEASADGAACFRTTILWRSWRSRWGLVPLADTLP